MKKANNTTKIPRKPNLDETSDFKKSPWLEDYKDCFTFKIQPMTEAGIDRICKELVDWAKNNKDALRIQDFHISKGINDSTYCKWKHRHENLKIAHETAMNYLAARREVGALNRKYSESMVIKMQHMYDPKWEEVRQREKQDKIDIAIAVKKATMEMGESKPQVIVLSELEFKKREECKE